MSDERLSTTSTMKIAITIAWSAVIYTLVFTLVWMKLYRKPGDCYPGIMQYKDILKHDYDLPFFNHLP
jgi:hypothetical protein